MSAPAKQVANRTVTSDEEWVALFPKHVSENYMSSATFMKKLTVASVSIITYTKDAFPEESYSNEAFSGLNLKILKDNSEDQLAHFLSSSLKQAFEAFDLKFVKHLALCFYNGDCVAENLIDYYIFEYAFNSDDVTSNTNSKNRNSNKEAMSCSFDTVKTRTVMLVQSTLVVMSRNCQKELPLNFSVSLRVYYTEDCPENYQVPGFRPFIDPDHLDATMSQAVSVGYVETPYHRLTAKYFVRDVLEDSDAAAASDCSSQSEITQAEHEDFQAELPRELDSDSSMEDRVCCPCGKQDRQGQELFVCQYCDTLQHAVCYGLLAPAPGAAHCCAACAARDPARTPTCSELVGLNSRRQANVCVWRRTLVLCSQMAELSGAQLQAQLLISPTSTARILRGLAAEQIICDNDHDDLETSREINHLRLKLTMMKLFQMDDDEDDTFDRLMMEEGQEATDPEDLLQLGELNCGSPNKTMANNAVLEDLPLSGSFDPVKHAPTNELKRKKGEDNEQKPRKLARLRSGQIFRKQN